MNRNQNSGPPRKRALLIRLSYSIVACASLLMLLPGGAPSASATTVDSSPSSSPVESSVQNSLSPSVLPASLLLQVDPADVTCGAGTVKIDGHISDNLIGLTSAIVLQNVPDDWKVRSSWQVVTGGGGSPQSLSLGGVETPVENPGGVAQLANPYIDNVQFAALAVGAAPSAFTYTVTLQLLNSQSQWVSGTQVAVGCGAGVTVTTTTLIGELPLPVPSPVQTPPVPGAINWGACADPAALANEQCATIQVPLDHFTNNGTVIELALNRFPASGVSNGPMMTNPGGPGGSGLGFARGMASIYAGTSLTQDYDIIGMDPRGVGDSSPAPFCLPGESPAAPDLFDPDWTAFYNASVPATAATNSGCSVAGARYLRFLGTRQVAADIDWIREAEDITRGSQFDMHYWGGSYGTRLGEVYLQQFGDHAGHVVLSGAVDPATTAVTFYTERVDPPDVVAQDLFFPAAPPETEEQFSEVIQSLTPSFGQTSDDVAVSAVVDSEVVDITLNSFLSVIGASLRSEASWTATVEFIADTWANVVGAQSVAIDLPPLPDEPLIGVNRGQMQRVLANASTPQELRSGMNMQLIMNVVNCIDLPGVPTSAAQMASLADIAVPGSPVKYLGWDFATSLASCTGFDLPLGDNNPSKVWPALPFPAGTPAPLVIGSVGDTATPFGWSEALTDYFNSVGIPAVLLTYEGAEHVAGVSWPPSMCIYGPINALFAGAGLPDPNVSCPFISTLNRQPPSDVIAQPGAGEATLTWTLSQQRLGGTVHGYAVQRRQVPFGDWELVDQSSGSCGSVSDQPGAVSCVVGGLTNGVAYQFRIATLPVYAPTALYSEGSNDVIPSVDPLVPRFTG